MGFQEAMPALNEDDFDRFNVQRVSDGALLELDL